MKNKWLKIVIPVALYFQAFKYKKNNFPRIVYLINLHDNLFLKLVPRDVPGKAKSTKNMDGRQIFFCLSIKLNQPCHFLF